MTPTPRPVVSAPDPVSAEPADAFLLRYLDANDAPCPACGYNLRALPQPRCPECGRDLHLKVALRVPPMRAWIVMAIATCTAAGLGVMFAALASSDIYLRSAHLTVLFFYASIPLAAFVILARRRITRWPPAVQITVATVLAALTLVDMLFFMSSMG